MPPKLRWALGLNVGLVSWILVQMGVRVRHQLSELPEAAGEPGIWATLRSFFTQHPVMEQVYNVAILYCVVMVFVHLGTQGRQQVKLLRYLSLTRDERSSARWTERLDADGIPVIVIREQAFVAMACGFFKRRIVISTGALHRFSEEEVLAVLYHELYHCRAYHPLQTVVGTAISRGMAFIPLVRDLSRYYEIWMELLADRYAMKRLNSERPLATVLLALVQGYVKQPYQRELGSVSHFAETAVNYRMEQLIHRHTELNIQVTNRRNLLISSLGLLFMMVFLLGYCI
ncbi:M56 family metallopeptidase [Paenibacillus daejeonensis]|uniref:M56 family metallopeptidase n=1 Tax=Paenibacillus daejeonensis TaxID=135193 RepID=UPI001B7FB676|nr:M56 family metallopeptidase [Paenibacillus daejeonensis]